jgi:hypothetical protein
MGTGGVLYKYEADHLLQAVEAHRVVRRRGCHIFLDDRLTDGGEVVSLTRRPSFTPPRKIPGTHFS